MLLSFCCSATFGGRGLNGLPAPVLLALRISWPASKPAIAGFRNPPPWLETLPLQRPGAMPIDEEMARDDTVCVFRRVTSAK